MQYAHKLIIMLFITVMTSLSLTACERETTNEVSGPVKIEDMAGGLHKLTLTADAAKRLAIQVAPVSEMQMGATTKKVVPYSAILYDPNGLAWVYVNPKPLTYMRAQIQINAIQGDLVYLDNGPAVGAPVVTVGPSELYGAEFLENIEP